MRLESKGYIFSTDEVIYKKVDEILDFKIGDVRNIESLLPVMRNVDIIINAAALKQVPTCEYFPYEAVLTNIMGAQNIVSIIANYEISVETVVCISTDKACKPINVMGMTKALQERIFIEGNLKCPKTRFVGVRYGNVLASRGSVIPYFINQISNNKPITITDKRMTRFFLSLDDAVDVIFFAIEKAKRGQIIIPKPPSAYIEDVARVLIGRRKIKKEYIGIRPGEKIHEIMISEEECYRTIDLGKFYAIETVFPESRPAKNNQSSINKEFTSADNLMTLNQIKTLLQNNNLTI